MDGGLLRYEDRGGTGDALLLVHAGVFSGWFIPLAKRPHLDGLRVVRIVRAGYGDGPAYTLHALGRHEEARQVEEALDRRPPD